MRIALLVVVVLMPIVAFGAGADNRCPKGYDWNESQKRCVVAPAEAKEGACTKSAKPWMLNCSTSNKLVSIDSIYQSGYYIERYSNGFFFLKKRGSSSDQDCATKGKPASRSAAEPADSEK